MIGDSTLLAITGFPILSGDRTRALSQVNSVVITRNVAMRFFNNTDVVGEMLTIRTETAGEKSFKITAVLDELPDNSISNILNINAEVFLPLENAIDFGNIVTDDWNTGQMIAYIKTKQNALPEDVSNASNTLLRHHGNMELQQRMKPEAISLLRYHSEQNNGAIGRLMFILGASAIFILLMAVINFVNIMIGAAKTRMKEIGVRKSLGGLKRHIRFQFLLEAMMRACMAGILAIGVYALVLPYFQDIIDKKLPGLLDIPLVLWMYFLLTVLLTGLLAGVYPSIHLSAAKTLDSLKGKMITVRGNINLSRLLVGLQFMLAIGAFIFSVVISRQVSFFLEKDLGYKKSAVLTVSSVPRVWGEEGINRMNTAKQEFLISSAIENVSLSWEIPNENYGNTRRVFKSGSEQEKAIPMPMLITDENFLATYQITLLTGKFFLDEGESRQPGTLVINESAQKALGVSVGDKVSFVESPGTFTVGGIVKDFNFFSLRQPMRPLIMLHTGEAQVFRYLSFKLRAGNLAAGVDAVESKWKQIFPNDPFEYAFMDDKLMRLYKTEIQLKKTSRWATLLMVVIVLLGVIGLTSLNVARRTKEIGVRKVLGASIGNILLLISKDYMKIMLIAMAVSVPLAWYALNSWLNGFAYRIGISWWMLILPGLLIGVATFLMVCIQSLKAALSNPKEALRHE
jgi:putative ABC transport system permease protein